MNKFFSYSFAVLMTIGFFSMATASASGTYILRKLIQK